MVRDSIRRIKISFIHTSMERGTVVDVEGKEVEVDEETIMCIIKGLTRRIKNIFTSPIAIIYFDDLRESQLELLLLV
jgi:hypothetical protein